MEILYTARGQINLEQIVFTSENLFFHFATNAFR